MPYCENCGEKLTLEEYNQSICFECESNGVEESNLYENLGPTGHGDICWSDADPGL